MCGMCREKKSKRLLFIFLPLFFMVAINTMCNLNGSVFAIKTLSENHVKTNSTRGSQNAQSFTYDSDNDKIIVFLINPNRIHVLNSETFKIEKVLSSKEGHNNGATYNPKMKTVIAAPTNHMISGTFFTYDADNNYKYSGKIHASGGGGTIAYSKQKDAIIAGGGGSYKIMKCNSPTRCIIKERFFINATGVHSQDGEVYGKYFYQTKWWPNRIHKIDLDTKKKVKSYKIGGSEIESITFIGKDVYLLHNVSGSRYGIYKLTDSSARELLYGAGDVEVPTYTGTIDKDKLRKEVSREKVKNIKKTSEKKSGEYQEKKQCSTILPEAWCRDENGTIKIINVALDVITSGIAILAVYGMMIAGFKYAAAAGRDEMIADAKRRIAMVVIGLAIWIFMYIFAKWLLLGEI